MEQNKVMETMRRLNLYYRLMIKGEKEHTTAEQKDNVNEQKEG